MKKHNFNAGPSILPEVVYEKTARAILDFNGTGLSILSISHRSKEFDEVMAQADSLLRELLDIPDNYKIIFIGGGASTHFFEVPANFLNTKAGYVNTGVWAKKAIKEAKRYGRTEVVASSEDEAADFLSLHIPATAQTRGSIGYELLMSMPKGATLVNTARKEVIDEAGVVRAMTEREDLKYITDIAPDAQAEMAGKFGKRFFATAKKMGAETAEANINAGLAAARQIVDFFKTGDTRFQVNR